MDEPRVDKDEQDGMKRGRIDLSVCIHKAPSEELNIFKSHYTAGSVSGQKKVYRCTTSVNHILSDSMYCKSIKIILDVGTLMQIIVFHLSNVTLTQHVISHPHLQQII